MARLWSETCDREWLVIASHLRSAIHGFLLDEHVAEHLAAFGDRDEAEHEWGLWPLFLPYLSAQFTHDSSMLDTDREECSTPEYSVTCSKSKAGGHKSKRGFVPANSRPSVSERRVIPNFIVHVPGNNDYNLLALELSKSTQKRASQKIAYERAKMVSYTSHDLDYRFAISLCVGVASNARCIQAVCLPHRALQFDIEQGELIDLRRTFGKCLEALEASTRKQVVAPIENTLAEIQRDLGFRDVTCDLVSDGVTPLPSHLVRFPVA